MTPDLDCNWLYVRASDEDAARQHFGVVSEDHPVVELAADDEATNGPLWAVWPGAPLGDPQSYPPLHHRVKGASDFRSIKTGAPAAAKRRAAAAGA